jgi:predicted RNA binding protein with dsRBD fold (UPF0201 family)|tara:strand:+ start:187 stop:447 length:261 start_codon:yes stop_codon:yes gene_type:complete
MIEKAILKINPNAKFTVAQNSVSDYEVVWLEETTPISKADIEEQLPIVEQEIADEAQAEIDKKASGKQKLLDLGLSEEEVKALIGV